MDSTDKYIGKLLDGRYEILERIGEGGMAVVYRAMCNVLNRFVAVKIMRDETAGDAEFKRRFAAESRAVAKLSHPNIVTVHDVSKGGEPEYIVMELIDGITLRQYMDIKEVLSWKEAAHFARQIGKALACAHANGIIHRDIKPKNIMLLKDGTIKVADFGIAALENEVFENNGEVIGSIHYIAPEQARGEMPDSRGDIYSLGVVLYEMLSGHLPYEGDTLSEVAMNHITTEPVSLREYVPDIQSALVKIVNKAMAFDIDIRYQKAEEFVRDLDDLLNNTVVEQVVNPAVVPVRSVSELSKKDYIRRKRRASRVSFALGVFLSLSVCLSLFTFIWNYWLKEVFSPIERVTMPYLIGQNFSTVINTIDPIYNFHVTYIIDNTHEQGTILEQSPESGRSMMVTGNGIDISVSVSSSMSAVTIPDVTGRNYKEAISILQNSGFNVSVENAVSNVVPRDIVISTSPSYGETLNNGSVVYVRVSSGTVTAYIDVPNVIGLSEEAAKSKLESFSLIYGGCERVSSDLIAGTVIGQSISAGTSVVERTGITLTISAGPVG